jgi:predicted membrane channel-forming protein YqfA (hemolysin III family)
MENPHKVGCPWYSITESWGAPNVKWCEETLCAWISEPANTWSNLAYIFAAIVLYRTRTNKPSIRKRLNYFSIAIALCGIGSFIYHASNNRLTQFLDFVGMFAVAWPLFGSSLSRLGLIRQENEINISITGSVLWCILVPVFNTLHIPIQLLVLSLIFSITGCEVYLFRKQSDRPMMTPSTNHFRNAIVCLLIAAFFSFLDVSRTWCDPKRHIVQGHAIWHLFSALGLFSAGKFFAEQLAYTEA